jgi:hypothetical protein
MGAGSHNRLHNRGLAIGTVSKPLLCRCRISPWVRANHKWGNHKATEGLSWVVWLIMVGPWNYWERLYRQWRICKIFLKRHKELINPLGEAVTVLCNLLELVWTRCIIHPSSSPRPVLPRPSPPPLWSLVNIYKFYFFLFFTLYLVSSFLEFFFF